MLTKIKTSTSSIYIADSEAVWYNLYIHRKPVWMVIKMAVSYKKLWKLLIDLNMKKKDLQQAAGVSPALIAKLGRNENVSTESLVKICSALRCDIGDIMEIIPAEGGNEN